MTTTYPLNKLHTTYSSISASAAEREKTRTFDRGIIQELKKGGFTRFRIPQEYGGLGLDLPETFQHFIHLAAADSNIAQALRPHFLAVENLLRSPDSPQRDYWLSQIGTGNILIANALTEKDNTVGHVSTTLRRNSDGQFLISGKKFYSTGSLYADIIEVRVFHEGIGRDTFVYVPRNSPGIKLHDDWTGFGQQLTASGTVEFHDVPVEPIGIFDRHYTQPSASQLLAQSHHLATLTGIASAIERDFSDYVRSRDRVFSHGLASTPQEDPLVQEVLGQISAQAFAARQILQGLIASLPDFFEDATPEQLSTAELNAFKAQTIIAPLVLDAATEAFEVGGASATLKEKGLDRHWRNARVLANHNPIMYRKRIIGEALLKGNHEVRQYQVGTKY